MIKGMKNTKRKEKNTRMWSLKSSRLIPIIIGGVTATGMGWKARHYTSKQHSCKGLHY